jgi:hypothetical protein
MDAVVKINIPSPCRESYSDPLTLGEEVYIHANKTTRILKTRE